MKKLLIISLILPLFCFSQYKLPQKLNGHINESTYNRIIGDSDYVTSLLKQTISNEDWIVISDRDDNILYSKKSNDSSEKGKLGMGQKCYVLDYGSGRSSTWFKIKSVDTGIEGWIDSRNLLFNEFCLNSEERDVTFRAMILISAKNLKNMSSDDIQEESVKSLYRSPRKKQLNKTAQKFQFFYVLKKSEGWALLAEVHRFDGINSLELGGTTNEENPGSVLAGWIKQTEITEWHHRVCLELTEDIDAYDFYEGNPKNTSDDKEIWVVDNKNDCDQKEFTTNLVQQLKLTGKRPNGQILRMPQINEQSDRMYKNVATVAKLGALDGQKPLSPEKEAEINLKLINIAEKIGKINILFVLDATSSLAGYANTIKSTIKQIKNESKLKYSGKTIQYGLATYRDYNEKILDAYKLESELTSDVNKISSKIDDIIFKSSENPHSEGMLGGLYRAIDETFSEKNSEQSNIVVLVGDAGDDGSSKYNEEMIAEIIKKQNISLVAIQVNHPETYTPEIAIPYIQFNKQISNIIKKTGEKWDKQMGNNGIDFIRRGNNHILDLDFLLSENIKEEDSFDPMFAWLRFTPMSNEPIPTKKLKDNIISSIDEFIGKRTEQQILLRAILNNSIKPELLEPGTITASSLDRMGILEEVMLKVQKQGDFAAEGWIKMSYHQGPDAFTPVIFLPKDLYKGKIKKTLNKLTGLKEKSSTSRLRETFVETMVVLVQSVLATEEKNDASEIEEIKNMSLKDVWNVILGGDYTGQFENKSLNDFLMTNRVDDLAFKTFLRNLQEEATDFLEENWDKRQGGVFKSNIGSKYYWIPMNEYPGCGE